MDLNLVVVWLGLVGLSSALLEPTPFPVELQECYEYRSFNMTPSYDAAMHIQNTCFRNYQYKQFAAGKIWSGPNITQEGVNYIASLIRQIMIEAKQAEDYHKNGGRKKRQAFPGRYRREVRSPGAYQPFADCVQRLQGEVSVIRIVNVKSNAKVRALCMIYENLCGCTWNDCNLDSV